jgi:GcrA cell cycle regulator
MQSTNWTPEHSSALQEYLAKGMSYSEAAKAINAKFNTAYTRLAALGRARRLGLLAAARPGDSSRLAPKAFPSSTRKMRERYASLSGWIAPVFEREETVKLRCVETNPAICHCRSLGPAIAATLMAATRRVKPSPSAASRAARIPAIARRIFI